MIIGLKIANYLLIKIVWSSIMTEQMENLETCCKDSCCADGCCSDGCNTGDCSSSCCRDGCCVAKDNCCS